MGIIIIKHYVNFYYKILYLKYFNGGKNYKKEEKFIVSLIRNENLENDYFANIDCQEVLRLLYNQKIFLRFYSKLLNIKNF